MFLIECPNCGPRDASEFLWKGEVHEPARDASTMSDREWAGYLYDWDNRAGITREWVYHEVGCRDWMVCERDTRTNRVERTRFAEPEGSW